MSIKSLLEPITQSGIKNTNFFEGRILSARDLRDQEEANHQHRRQLAMLSGSGIVNGLEVSVENKGEGSNSPIVRVSGGKAVNLDGDILNLSADYVDLELSRILEVADPDATDFRNCGSEASASLAPSGAGIYALIMSPAAKYEGFALKSGLQNRGTAHQCDRAYVVEGAQFRLVEFDPTAMPDVSEETKKILQDNYLNPSDPVGPTEYQRLSKLQNIVAHTCFGTEASKSSPTDVLTTVANPVSGFDALLGSDFGLQKCDVPLCLIYWTFDGIGFIDNWALKRRLYTYENLSSQFAFSEARSSAVFEAMLYQFHDQLDNLLLANITVTNLLTLSAFDYFQFLPAVGILPQYTSTHSGFNHNTFFSRQPHRAPEYISEEQVREIFLKAAHYAPIRVEEKQLVWLYKTWQRDYLSTQGSDSVPHMIFTSGHLPYQANAKFDLARWDYSHYTQI